MKLANTNATSLISKSRALILLGALAAVTTTVACHSKSKPVEKPLEPFGASARQAVVKTAAYTNSQPAPVSVANNTSAPVKAVPPKMITYKSRDYGVSFVYPWQYTYVTAKKIANDESLQPKLDGDDGQFTLARIDIPKGFYPDSDFERGYFTLSLNEDISQEQCESALGIGNEGKVQKETINGVDFGWVETEVGGGGSAAKLRNYGTYVNGACYQVELAVTTKNEQGIAREVNPDQVLRRLDAILKTVNILPMTQKPAAKQVVSSGELPKTDAQK
jgi:hypothetical protein